MEMKECKDEGNGYQLNKLIIEDEFEGNSIQQCSLFLDELARNNKEICSFLNFAQATR